MQFQADIYSMVCTSQVTNFINTMHTSHSFYGLKPETLDSLLLDILPPLNHTYIKLGENSLANTTHSTTTYLLQELLIALRNNAGFNIPEVSSIA